MSQQPVIDFGVMLGGFAPVGEKTPSVSTLMHMSPPPAPAQQETSLPAVPSMEIARRRLDPFRAKAGELEKKAIDLAVNSDATQVTAVALAGEVKKALKKVEDTRKGYVGPLNEHVREVNALAAEIRAPLERAESALKKQLNTYAAQQELERRKAEEKARQEAAAEQERLNAEAAAAGVEAPVVPEVVTPETVSTVRTASGTAFMQGHWTFEVADMSKVPSEYLMLDEKKVRAAIKTGTRSIPGLNIFEQKSVAIRS